MNTEYHCPRCGANFSEAKLPNINKIHERCETYAKIVRYTLEKKDEAES